ncbi:LysR substrate-binding domain-containing protein [Streptomyces sp. M19]
MGEDRCDPPVPSGHPLTARAEGGPVRRAWPREPRWIRQPPGSVRHDWLVRTPRASGDEPDLVGQAAENHTRIAVVAAGLGPLRCPGRARPAARRALAPPLEPVPGRRSYVFWRTGAARRPAIAESVRAPCEAWPRRTG